MKVYDRTDLVKVPLHGPSGYSMHSETDDNNEPTGRIEIYTDDGRGNGEFIAIAVDKYWARRLLQFLK